MESGRFKLDNKSPKEVTYAVDVVLLKVNSFFQYANLWERHSIKENGMDEIQHRLNCCYLQGNIKF